MIKKWIKSGKKADKERLKGWKGVVRSRDLKNREVSVKIKWRQMAQK